MIGETSLIRLANLLSSDEICRELDHTRKVDLIGRPTTFSFGNFGVIDPSTIKYVFIKSLLLKTFDLNSKTGLQIVEIGGGYGGQAASFLLTEDIKKYTIIDLPEVVSLAQKFLSRLGFGVGSNLAFFDVSQMLRMSNKETFDLGIADSSLAELSYELQVEYFDRVLSHCDYIFVHWNTCHFRRGIREKGIFINRLKLEYEVFETASCESGQYIFAAKRGMGPISQYKFLGLRDKVKIYLKRLRYIVTRGNQSF